MARATVLAGGIGASAGRQTPRTVAGVALRAFTQPRALVAMGAGNASHVLTQPLEIGRLEAGPAAASGVPRPARAAGRGGAAARRASRPASDRAAAGRVPGPARASDCSAVGSSDRAATGRSTRGYQRSRWAYGVGHRRIVRIVRGVRTIALLFAAADEAD